MEQKDLNLIANLAVETNPQQVSPMLLTIHKDNNHSVLLDMWGYFIAEHWDGILNDYEIVHSTTTTRYIPDMDRYKDHIFFNAAAVDLSMRLLERRDDVYTIFDNVPARLDMSHSPFAEAFCQMLFSVSKLFDDNGYSGCLERLKKAGFLVDMIIIDRQWYAYKELLFAIKRHIDEEMSFLFVASAFYIISRWIDNDECLLYDFRDDLFSLHKRLGWKLLKDEYFDNMVADHYRYDKYGYYFSYGVNPFAKGVFGKMRPAQLNEIIDFALAFRQKWSQA